MPPDLKKIDELDRKYGHRIDMEWVPAIQAKYGLKLAATDPDAFLDPCATSFSDNT